MGKYWLLKTEPESYSIDDLAQEPDQTTCWDGVRNYQARNFIRDEMRLGDLVLIYHSNANPPAVVGTARISRAAYPDPTAWDPTSHHFDAKSDRDHPRWWMVDLTLEEVFARPIGLPILREAKSLQAMELLRKGSRLSVQPVRKAEFAAILNMARQKSG